MTANEALTKAAEIADEMLREVAGRDQVGHAIRALKTPPSEAGIERAAPQEGQSLESGGAEHTVPYRAEPAVAAPTILSVGACGEPSYLVAWLKSWWQISDAERADLRKIFGPDVAHLLRGVADMIEQPNAAPQFAELRGEKK